MRAARALASPPVTPTVQVRPMSSRDEYAVTGLLMSREAADRRAALSEHKALRVFTGGEIELVAEGSRSVVGYAHVAHHAARAPFRSHWACEVVVDPDAPDGVAIAADLIGGALGAVPHGEEVTVWAWRRDEVTAARQIGMREIRALHEMRRSLPIEERAPLPHGIVVSTFRPGRDEAAWLEANNAAFASHRENGALDIDNLRRRMERPWFDPRGFLLAWAGNDLVGSCWTKLYEGGLGEIYIISVVPTFQGRGLGTSLVEEGLHDLAERQGATEAMLYVDAADLAAVEFYRNLEFEVAFTTREFAPR